MSRICLQSFHLHAPCVHDVLYVSSTVFWAPVEIFDPYAFTCLYIYIDKVIIIR